MEIFNLNHSDAAKASFSKQHKINLIKDRENIIELILSKSTNETIISRAALVLDISGSMRSLYKSLVVQNIIEKIYPIARKFNANNKLDVWVFSNTFNRLTSVNEFNFDSFAIKEILNKKTCSASGRTEYAPVMKDVLNEYKSKNTPAYVIFITDSQNTDKNQTQKILIETSAYPIFWQYIGIGLEEFTFLKKSESRKERMIKNAHFFHLNDISTISDHELYERLLNEFPRWYLKAKEKNIIQYA